MKRSTRPHRIDNSPQELEPRFSQQCSVHVYTRSAYVCVYDEYDAIFPEQPGSLGHATTPRVASTFLQLPGTFPPSPSPDRFRLIRAASSITPCPGSVGPRHGCQRQEQTRVIDWRGDLRLA